jgi:hypothetical protein
VEEFRGEDNGTVESVLFAGLSRIVIKSSTLNETVMSPFLDLSELVLLILTWLSSHV